MDLKKVNKISNEISECFTTEEINILLGKLKKNLEFRTEMNSIKSISNFNKKVAERIETIEEIHYY